MISYRYVVFVIYIIINYKLFFPLCACAYSSVCNSCIPYLVFSLLFSPVLTDLQHADLITDTECTSLSDISDVVECQSVKSSEVMTKTAEVLSRHGFLEESKLLTGTQISNWFTDELQPLLIFSGMLVLVLC